MPAEDPRRGWLPEDAASQAEAEAEAAGTREARDDRRQLRQAKT